MKLAGIHRARFVPFMLVLSAGLAGGDLPAALAEQQDPVDISAALPATASLRSHIDGELLPADGRQLDWRFLRAFYTSRDYLPVWINGEQLRHEAYFAIDQLARSVEDGLFPEEYHLSQIRHWLDTKSSRVRSSMLELLLTDGLLRYIRDIRNGRLEPRLADAEWHIRPAVIDPVDVLTAIIQSDSIHDALQDLPPRHRGYRRLKSLLQAYRSLEASGGWPVIPPGETLEKGMYDQRVHLLRHRLMLAGGPTEFDYRDSFQFDAALESAVGDFQERHGLEADGIVGRRTLAELNVPVSERIQQILLNMERWRWLPGELGERYLLVNMAGFELLAVENEETVMDMRVIIGRPYRSTPAFAGEMRYLVFNPYWNVPHKLAIEDLLPKQQSDPDYLKNQGFRVYASWRKGAMELDPASLDWSAFSRETFGYRLRQDPGDSNSLGRIKFMLPNPHAIYLHDTPSRHLFRRPVRTFSSGCIRVEKPVQLANFVLEADAGVSGIDVQEAIDSGENRTVSLPRTIPVYLLYLTSWIDDWGRVHFRDDVYGRDVLVQRAWGFGSG
jgi:murein L,D-transpeptidase YcbB/YkuD